MELAIVFLVNLGSSVLKKWIYPKYGAVGIQVTVFILATIGALYITFKESILGLREVIETALSIFAVAVAFYEVILSKFTWFRDGE